MVMLATVPRVLLAECHMAQRMRARQSPLNRLLSAQLWTGGAL